MTHIPVRQCMTEHVIAVGPDTTLLEAYQLMRDHCVRHLPVLDEAGQPIGILTRGDIREAWPSALAATDKGMSLCLQQQPVSRIMSHHLITIGPEASLETAAQLMLEKKIGGLPVIEGGRLVGILTESDIFRVVAFGEGALHKDAALAA